MSRKVKKSTQAHFTLGNDERVMLSSYTRDFDGIRFMRGLRSARPSPPKSAQVKVVQRQEHSHASLKSGETEANARSINT